MIIAVVGAGGKTTRIHKLAEQYRKLGKKVLVTTTTHMYLEDGCVLSGNVEEIIEKLNTCEYCMAGLLEENLDPVFDLIEKCAKEIHKNGGWIGVCGELGANLSYTERFVNMKIDELSVSPPYILGIKKKICSLE